MTYQQTVDWLFSQVPNYQQQGGSAYKPGLETIRALLEQMGNPQNKIKTIHVAGTNGKGSVCHILAACLIENKIKTGLFTSPHILDFRERIKINGTPVSEEFVIRFVAENKRHFEDLRPSFFELTTAMAFQAFAENDCELSVIETGLGGRLDSTNVLQPELSVITNIGLEHTHFLGDTIQEVATEKAGIIKQGIPVVIGRHNSESLKVMKEVAANRNADLTGLELHQYETDLVGAYQQENLSTADTALQVLANQGWNLDRDKSLLAMTKVSRLTGFRGRMQVVRRNPTLILDAAHNKHSFEQLVEELQQFEYDQLYMIFSAANDKDLSMMEAIPKEAELHLCPFQSERSYSLSHLSQKAEENKILFYAHSCSSEAYGQVLEKAENNDLVVVCGSFYLLEEILRIIS